MILPARMSNSARDKPWSATSRAISSALTKTSCPCFSDRYSRANVVLPAPFGPAMIMTCGTHRLGVTAPCALLRRHGLVDIHLAAEVQELLRHRRHALLGGERFAGDRARGGVVQRRGVVAD